MNMAKLEKLVMVLYWVFCSLVCMYPASMIKAFAEEIHGYKYSIYIFAFSWVLLTLVLGLSVLALITAAAGKD